MTRHGRLGRKPPRSKGQHPRVEIHIIQDAHGICWQLAIDGERVNAGTAGTLKEAWDEAIHAKVQAAISERGG